MRQLCKPLVFSVLAALAGCASVARIAHHEAATNAPATNAPATNAPAVDAAAAVRSIRLCRTQVGELQQQLGVPTRDGIMHKQHIVSWIVQWDAPTRYLAVLLNPQNTVVDLYWNVPSEIPWTPTDQCLAP